jgi:copper chaperone CopZ
MLYRRMLSVAVIFGASLIASFAEAADQQVVLMLGGESCEKHMREVKTALKRVERVRSVDLTSMEGHAIVRAETGSVKPEQLTAAVGGVKGTNWHCTAEVMK